MIKKNKENLNYRKNYYTSDDSGKMFLSTIFSTLVASLILYILAGIIATAINLPQDAKFENQLWFVIIASIIGQLGFFLVFLIYNKWAKINPWAVNIKMKQSYKTVLVCIVVAVIALLGLQMFVSCFDYVLGLTGFKLNEGLFGLPLDNFGWFVLNLILLGLLPAVFEELIFRGVILNGLRKTLSDEKAIALTALMFALMHANLQQFVYPLLFGLVLGWVMVRTNSLLASMIVHFTNNFFVVLLAYLEKVTSLSLEVDPSKWWVWLIAIALLLITILIFFIIDKFFFKHKNKEEIERFKDSKLSIFVWIGIGAGVVLLIIKTVMNFIS